MNRRLLAVILIVIIVAALASIVFHSRRAGPRGAPANWAPLGRMAAQEVRAGLAEKGDVVAVLFDTRPAMDHGLVTAFDAFTQALPAAPGIRLVRTQVFRPVQRRDGGWEFPAQQLGDLWSQSSRIDLIVCFGGAGLVRVNPAALGAPGDRRPRLVSVAAFTDVQLRQLFAKELVAFSLALPLPLSGTPAEPPVYPKLENGLAVQLITPATAPELLGAVAR